MINSPTRSSLTQDVRSYNDRLRTTPDFGNLPEGVRETTARTMNEGDQIAARLDTQIAAIQTRRAVAQQAAGLDLTEAQAVAAAHRTEVFAAIERSAMDIDRVDTALSADTAADETTLEHVASGRLRLDANGVGATLTPVTVPTGDELRALQQERATLRELPQQVLEQRYLTAVNRGDNPRLVVTVESAPASLPLVRAGVRAQARQIRVANYTAAVGTHTRKGLELRSMSHGHAVRAIEERIKALKIF
jgi:hypothetical protein